MANHYRWLVVYRDGHQRLEDDEKIGEWESAVAAQQVHGQIVALQIIGATLATVRVPDGAEPIMRRRRAVDLNIATGEQTREDLQTIIGWQRDDEGIYLHCWPTGEALLTDELNPAPVSG